MSFSSKQGGLEPRGYGELAEPGPGGPGDAWTLDRQRRHGVPATRNTAPPAPTPPSDVPLGCLSEGDGLHDDALGLVDRCRPSSAPSDLRSELVQRFDLGDFAGALRAAELLLGVLPEDGDGLRYAKACRACLEQRWMARLGSLDRVARVAVPAHEIRWLGLDHRAGFLLAQVDGCLDLESLLDISGMSRLEALQTLAELLGAGTISLAS